ncbi:hypothetical protein PO909_028041 [Leuciscus waleckii]
MVSVDSELTAARTKRIMAWEYEIRDTHMVEESVMMTLKDKADFSSFKPRPFNMREFYDRTGHDIKEMLLSCYFRGAECSAEDFTVVSMNAISVSGVLKDEIRSVDTGMMGKLYLCVF